MKLTSHTCDRLRSLLRLKEVHRTGWTRFEIPRERVESVADHSYGVALLAWFLCPPELDSTKVLEMALIHDLAEVVTGDITPSQGVPREVKTQAELSALAELTHGLERAERALVLLREYQNQESHEARFLKMVDKLEMALQSLAYEDDFSIDLTEFRSFFEASGNTPEES